MTPQPWSVAAALQRWNVVQALLWPAVLLAAGPLASGPGRSAVWLALLALSVASYGWLLALLRAGRTIADRVTVVRFLGLLVACGLAVAAPGVTWPIWLGLVAVIVADLADGWAARRFGGSEAGAVLDMETDQLATLGLSLVAWQVAGVPWWVMALPACRWLTVGLHAMRGRPAYDPKPRDGDNRQARLLCALMLALLLASLVPGEQPSHREGAAALAVLVLAWSHGRDLAHQARRRVSEPRP